MAVLTTLAVIGAVAAVGTAVMSYKQAQAQKKAVRAQQRQADLANARERRSAIRNARVQRASIESQAALTGLTGSSAATGSISNVQQRLGENLSFLDQMVGLSRQASAANEQAAAYASRGAAFGALGGAAKSFGVMYGTPAPTPVGG